MKKKRAYGAREGSYIWKNKKGKEVWSQRKPKKGVRYSYKAWY